MFRYGFIALASLLAVPVIDASPANAKVKIDINIGGPGSRGISCRQGANILDDQGYYRIVAEDCSGRTFEYRARRNGKRYWIEMNSRNGDIIDRERIY